jgi:hypothetical protein
MQTALPALPHPAGAESQACFLTNLLNLEQKVLKSADLVIKPTVRTETRHRGPSAKKGLFCMI